MKLDHFLWNFYLLFDDVWWCCEGKAYHEQVKVYNEISYNFVMRMQFTLKKYLEGKYQRQVVLEKETLGCTPVSLDHHHLAGNLYGSYTHNLQ